MQMNEEDFGASRFPRFKLSQSGVAPGRYSAILLLAFALLISGCGVHFNVLPTVSLSPASISIHKVDVGATSGSKIITITNTSPAKAVPLSITAFNITTNFIVTGTTCPKLPATLASGASCTVSVAFRPTTSGNLTGTFSLTDNATNTPASVQLSGPGGIGFLLFNPTSLSFPGVAPGTVSQPQTSTLTNEATYPVAIAKFTVSGKFSEGDDCPRAPETLAPGGTCTVTVTSNPVASGAITGSVNVEDSFGNITQLYLSGSDQGLQNTGQLMFSPASLLWGKLTVGGSAAAKTVTVTNLSPSTVNFSSITTGPDFVISASTCGASLAAGASCTVSVVFRPTVAGSISELLTFNDNLTGSPQAVSLKGTGVFGDMLFTPTSLLFAGVDPGQASPAQAATLTNETTGNLSLTSVTVTGHFAQTNNCPSTLGPQASCTFEVTADPVANGTITGSVNVKDNLGNTVQLFLQGQGGGVNQVLSFSPNPISWGKIDVGQTAAAKTLTVDNGQTVPVTFYSISIGPDFIQTASTCPTAPDALAAGSSCTISLAFRPLSAGAKSEVITFTDDAPGGNQSVSLMGTAVVGSLLFNPTSLSFAGVAPNTVSQAQTATLTNEQTAAITLASITVSGHFAETNDCGGSLGPGASCTFTVTSNPVIDGPTQGSVNVKDGSGNTTQLYLSGMGGVPIIGNGSGNSQVALSPSSVAFGNVSVGQTSGASEVTLSNGTTSEVTISSITAGPDIYETANTCPIAPYTLAGGASCAVSVAFRPQSTGAKSEPLTFAVSAWSSPQSATITGTGMGGNLLFNPTSLSFGSMTAGSTSTPQTATLTNQESTAITLNSIKATGTFLQTNDCPTTLDIGASCTVSVSADPQAAGSFSGTVDATDSSGAVTQLYLSGTATEATGGATAPVTLSPTTLTWGNVTVGGSSGAKTVTFQNNQTVATTINSITTGADFVLSATGSNCPTSGSQVPAGGSCTVSVIFRPLSSGAKSEPLTFTDNAANSPQSAVLSGTGTVGSLLFTPGSLSFAATTVGNTSASQTATLANKSGAAITLSSITVSGAFGETNNCPTGTSGTLAAGASCTVTVTSKPTAAGADSGSVNVKVSGGSGTQLYLSGTGLQAAAGSATLAPSSYHFTGVTSGASGTPVAFTLTNNGSTSINLSQIAVSNTNFTETNNCGTSLAGNASCTISVTFTPQSVGSQTATLTVTDAATNNPQTAALSGTGLAGASSTGSLKISPAAYTFPNQASGTTSSAETLTVTNTLKTPVTISSISIPAPFNETNNCGILAAGANCAVSLTYSPTAVGYTSADLTFTYNASGSPQTVFIAGNSFSAVTVKPTAVTFSRQVIGRASTPQTITVTNNQSTALTINSITPAASTSPSVFTVSNTCIPQGQSAGTVAPNSSCAIDVTFTPTKATNYSGSVTVSYNAPGSPQTATYTGTGIVADSGVRVTVTPQSACVMPSNTEQYTADVVNTTNTSVKWYVDGTQNGTSSAGTISAGGLYTAPGATGTHTIEAISQASTTATSSTTVSVTSSPSFSIYPYTASIPTGAEQTFQAQLCGVPDTDTVSFAVDGITGGNATVGTVTANGVYTAPNAPGKHTMKVTDSKLGKSSGAVVTVYSGVAIDFGSRTNQTYPIPSGILGVNHVDDLHGQNDISLLHETGINLSRTYANLPQVYATQTPDWTQIDPRIANLQSQGMHVLLQITFTPPWLQPNPNPCGAGSVAAAPTDINAWAKIAASYVAHMDANFPGVVTDYELENEPDAGGLCGISDKLDFYINLYGTAAQLMKQQAAADGATIRVGGPTITSGNTQWISTLLSNSSTAPYVDFVSYHNYMQGTPQANGTWDTYNGITPLYEATQGSSGAAATYAKVSALVGAGKQPLGAKTPVYVDEYNSNWSAVQECCRNNPTYSPVWNALYVSDLLNTVYSGSSAVPGKMVYFSANAYPYFCMVGAWDSAMDCQYPLGTAPVPYPQYYAYQLMASPNYLGLNSGGYMAASVSPASDGGGIETTAFYTSSQDSVLIVNPTAQDYSNITVTLQNVGLSSPQAVLYQIVNGNQITSSSLQLMPSGTNYTATISVPAYTVMAIAVQ